MIHNHCRCDCVDFETFCVIFHRSLEIIYTVSNLKTCVVQNDFNVNSKVIDFFEHSFNLSKICKFCRNNVSFNSLCLYFFQDFCRIFFFACMKNKITSLFCHEQRCQISNPA